MTRLLFFLLLLGCAQTPRDKEVAAIRSARDSAELNRGLSGLSPGAPQDCVDQTQLRGSSFVGNTILYRTRGSRIYRVDMGPGCFGLRPTDAITTSTPGTQLCRGEIARSFEPVSGINTGSCVFGAFVPYNKSNR